HKVFLMMGLCCDSCSLAIEDSIRRIEGVRAAAVDFGKKELRLELDEKTTVPWVLAESQRRARKIVRGVRVRSEEVNARRLKRLKLSALAVGVPLFGLGLTGLVPAGALSLFAASYLLFGIDVVFRALRNVLRGKVFDEHFLMTVATIGAFAVGAYAEAAAVMLFYKIGVSLEDLAVERSRRSIRSVFALRPEYARRLTAAGTEKVRPEEVAVGEQIVVKPGERVPLDGTVTKGSAYVDTHLVSGEAVPKRKNAGDDVVSGSIVTNSPLTLTVAKKLSDSLVTRIADYVEKAARKKSQAEHYLTVFTRYYTPLVVGAAVLLAFVPPLLIPGQIISDWLYRALIFLVISCPCALVLSVPLSFSAGIGSLARAGILVKGARYVEALRRVDTVVFDKTGTLTEGVFEVVVIAPEPPYAEGELLSLAALAESYSAHPAAVAIRNAAGLGEGPVERAMESIGAYDEIAGLGVKATVDGRTVLVGNRRLLLQEHVTPPSPEPNEAGTTVYVAVDNVYAGRIVIADRIRPSARKAVRELTGLGVERTVM
ncbi:MAG TPA: heavy metal translocating P-type ATPase, partial [Spirochaetia bacterium]|nr:heavy metal translocating P-type ATPase [Spirochaetia bacterium]